MSPRTTSAEASSSTGTVASLVASAKRRTHAARALEAACLGATAALATAASAEISGAGAVDADVLAIAAVVGALCAITWWREHRRGALDVARRADARLGQDGALVAAFESERAGGLGLLLASRVLSRLPRGAASRAAHRPAAAFAGAPLAGAALLFAAIEATPPPRGAELLEGASLSLASAAASAGAGDPRSGELERLAAETAELAQALARDPDAVRERLEHLWRELGDLEASPVPDPDPVGVELGRARALAGAALGRPERPSDPDRREPPSPSSAVGASESASGAPAHGGDAGSQIAGAESTMSGSARPSEAPATASAPTEAPDAASEANPEAGTFGPRWWPEAYDEVVARWLAARDGPP